MKSSDEERKIFFDFFRKQHPKPYFQFKNLKNTSRLEFELIDDQNYLNIYYLFKDDPNPFISNQYKEKTKLEEYFLHLINYSKYSPKHGAIDWLVKIKNSDQYIGLLNLHELSLETFNDNHKKCMIGFATKEEFRGQYYTIEAVNSLINYIFNDLDLNKIIAHTMKNNEASKSLLKKLNFQKKTEKYHYSNLYDYFELEKE